MPHHPLDTIEVLIISWILGGESDRDRIPTSHGILDRALQAAVDHGAFPPWIREELTFVDSRIGLQCVELPSLLNWAQRAQLTTAPNPTYHSTQVQISRDAALKILSELDLAKEDATKWGTILRQAVDTERESMSNYPDAAIEEY
jgi:hypothetical protein